MLAGHILLVTFGLLTEALLFAETSQIFLVPMSILPFIMLVLMTANAPGFAVASVVGVVLGALAGSMSKGHFRWEACEDPRELRRQIMGAAIMGPGAILAVGCSVGQGISAFSVLAFSAPLAFLAIVAGAALGLKQLISGFAPAE